MDEIEYKLASNNPILITHGISKILETVKNKLTNNENDDTSKIPELWSLIAKCKNENALVSSVACQALVTLVERGHLETSLALSKLIAILGETKNYLAVTTAICNLLILDLKQRKSTNRYTCPFSIKAPQHPLITVLTQNTDAWRNILGQMQSILHHCEPGFVLHRVELLRPVFMYILCNPSMNLSENCRHQTWHLLIRTHETLNLQLEIIQWLRTNDLTSCINTNHLVLELTELSLATKHKELCTSLAPLTMALAFDLLKHNYDPRSNILMMENILEHSNDCIGSIMISLLSDMLLITPVIYLHDIMRLGVLILTKLSSNEVIAHSLLASILPWMAYATPLSSNALDVGKELIKLITTKLTPKNHSKQIYSNKIFSIICNANQDIQFYANLCACLDDLDEMNMISWLEKLSEIPNDFLYNYKNILGGIISKFKNVSITSQALKLLLKIIKFKPASAGYVLSLILYKLSNIEGIQETKELLFALPQLAVSKENIPIIVHTFHTLLNSEKSLKYLAINLYLKAWVVEPRCHRHLFSALIEMSKNDKTVMASIACAKAMQFICETKPEHGTELVPLLSQTLNHCTDTAGSAASALALRGISALCVAGIADVCSTWRVLSPKMNKEVRPIVIKSMCKFFADIPSNATHADEEYDQLLEQVLGKLWTFACFETTRNIEVVEAAFKALTAYNLSQMKLSFLPEKFKTNLQLPQKYAQASTETGKKPEEIMSYVPGSCWITMLETVYEPTRSMAGDFLIKHISEELYGFKTGIYMWSMGEPINYKYLSEKSPIRAVGEYLRRYEAIDHINKQKIMLECLRIFSHKYLKALPPIKWELLNPAINMSDEARAYGIALACHQASVSPSAKEFLSKYISKMTKNCAEVKTASEEFKKIRLLCSHLEDICRGVMSNVLGPFLDVVMNCITEKAINNDKDGVMIFNELMEHYANILKDDLVHHDNKTLITDILEKLLDRIQVENEIFPAYVKPMLEMSIEQIERITLPSVWTEVTNNKLKKAIVIRAGLVLKRDNAIPLSWMDVILSVSSSIPGIQTFLLSHLKRIQSQLRTDKSNSTWSLDLMCKIQTTILNTSEEYSTESLAFLCDVFFVTIITFACDDCLLVDDEIIVTSHDTRARLFPHALATIIEKPHWMNNALQIMEWLNFMRTSVLSDTYKIVFHNALVSLKKEKCLDELWTSYISIKSPINL
ncbi:focadhesin [Chelonus insularis]|uniref:focadhesin n=1 Tax=Chelonus insularis TaxID=460826 RepID=UPI00158B41D2|nr:focadhesin [Chelonus insularis]